MSELGKSIAMFRFQHSYLDLLKFAKQTCSHFVLNEKSKQMKIQFSSCPVSNKLQHSIFLIRVKNTVL